MTHMHVIARAFGGEPLDRVVLKKTGRLVYIANPASLEAVEAGKSSPVGFPAADIFPFNQDLFGRLQSEWDRLGRTLPASWPDGVT